MRQFPPGWLTLCYPNFQHDFCAGVVSESAPVFETMFPLDHAATHPVAKPLLWETSQFSAFLADHQK